MKKTRFIIALLIVCMISTSSAFALQTEPSTQAITQQSTTEMQKAQDKATDATALYKAEQDLNNGKISQSAFNSIKKNYINEYGNFNRSNSTTVVGATAATVGSTTYGVLSIPCVAQTQTWYCGPASAYNVLSGYGITTNPSDGRSLTQTNLATDLGALSTGAAFSGTWSSTMNSWLGSSFYYAQWASSSANVSSWISGLMTKTVADVHYSGLGVIYDTHQTSSDTTNRLVGYTTVTTDVWHYVAGDGYDTTSSLVHYADCNVYRSSAFGSHWISSSIMGNVTWDRGMVW